MILNSAITVKNELSGEIRNVAAEVKNVREEIKRGNAETVQSFEKVGTTLEAVARNSKRGLTAVAADFKLSLDLVGSGLSKVRSFFDEFSRWEDAATRMAPLVGGMNAAADVVSHLRDEAASGTMSFEQLTGVAGRLASVFAYTDDIKKWTTVFHNLSAGTGTDINELIGNFVKLKAAGRVTGEFPEMFAQKGINIFGELEKQTGKTTVELRKMAAAGTLSFAEIEKALLSVATGDGIFAGRAAAMSDTFGGSVNTMLARWDILKAELVKPIAVGLTPAIRGLSDFLGGVASDWSKYFSAGTIAVGGFTLALVAAKTAIVAFNAAASLNPVYLLGTALAAAGVGIYSFLSSLKDYTDIVAESNREWAESVKQVSRAYDTINSKGALDAQKAQDDARMAEAKEKFEEKFGVRWFSGTKAERTVGLQFARESRAYLEGDGANAGWIEKNSAVYKEQIRDAEALLHYERILNEEKLLGVKYEERKVDIEKQEADAKEDAAKEAAKAASSKAAEALAAFDEATAQRVNARKLAAADLQQRPALMLSLAGFADAGQLDSVINFERAEIKKATAEERATQEQVDNYRKLVELRERYNELAASAASARNAEYERADIAKRAAQTQLDLLRAEIAGNHELAGQIKERVRYEDLLSKHLAAGIDYGVAARLAKEQTALEAKRQAREQAGLNPTGGAIGAGLVSSSQASVGGGRSLIIGGTGLIDISRRQLDMLSRNEKNTASVPEFNTAPVLA